MVYCTGHPKATVYYQFANGAQRVFETNKTPINVDISHKYVPPFTGGQCPVQYWVDYNITYEFVDGNPDRVTFYFDGVTNRIPVYGQILDIYSNCTIGGFCGSYNSIQGLSIQYLDYRNNTVGLTGLPHTSQSPPSVSGHAFNDRFRLISYQVTSIRPVDGISNNCGDPKTVCTLKVLHNNQVIFTDQGACSPSFNVVCGEECPPNHLKCSSPGYPGYCCIPCSEVAGELRSIKNQVRSVSNG